MRPIKFRACHRKGRGKKGMFEVNKWVAMKDDRAQLTESFPQATYTSCNTQA